MNAYQVTDALITDATGTSYLANVAIQNVTPLQKLDLISGREFVWGFWTYNITIQRIISPDGSPVAISGSATNITVNGNTFNDVYMISWNLTTQRDDVAGKFYLQETVVYQFFKEDPS